MEKIFKAYYKSPIGLIEIAGTEDAVTSVEFMFSNPDEHYESNECVEKCAKQLDEYFHGKRKEFELNLEQEGTEFQNKVWNELMKIPFGETVSYNDIAESLGSRNSIRAVGSANGKNKIAIIVPCHRVIGSDGSLVGYGGGKWRKERLIKLERGYSSGEAQLDLF